MAISCLCYCLFIHLSFGVSLFHVIFEMKQSVNEEKTSRTMYLWKYCWGNTFFGWHSFFIVYYKAFISVDCSGLSFNFLYWVDFESWVVASLWVFVYWGRKSKIIIQLLIKQKCTPYSCVIIYFSIASLDSKTNNRSQARKSTLSFAASLKVIKTSVRRHKPRKLTARH